ncbi:MFS transporter [Roseibium porphyridii]|uniref:MFS transporter n=1 Tax=Roseibium porphyridii TaxID=2866279 RepID=A0ABY8F7U3_9HYPH|nr:MFS transporter [Roseibium sp. KMA01]WFE91454.1 MFS transporter [Roseibium sp. KMA01]
MTADTDHSQHASMDTAASPGADLQAEGAQGTQGSSFQAGTAPVTISGLAIYSAMAFPLAFAGLPIYLHAPDFYAVTLGQPIAALGAVLLGLRLFDAIQDPLIGSLSDRFHHRRGVILGAGAVLLGAGFWMLFHPMEQIPLLWFAVSVLLCTTGFSVVSINFQTLGGLWRTHSRDRTRVTASREAVGLLGLLAASVAPPLLAGLSGKEAAFHWLSLVYLPFLAIALWLLLRWMRQTPVNEPPPNVRGTGWLKLIGDRWRALFFGMVFLNTFASAIPAVLVLFFIRDRLEAESFTGLFLLIYFLAGALSMPIWTWFAARLGKMRAWQCSLGAAILTFCWAALLQPGDITAYALVCALSGLALGADLALPPAILADHIDEDSRQADASRLFSVMAFQSKGALAVATGLALPLLGLAGYQPGGTMTPELGFLLSVTYAGVPCVLKLLALIGLLWFEKDLALNKSPV